MPQQKKIDPWWLQKERATKRNLGQWRERDEAEAGHRVTWSDKKLNETSGDILQQPYAHLCTMRIMQ